MSAKEISTNRVMKMAPPPDTTRRCETDCLCEKRRMTDRCLPRCRVTHTVGTQATDQRRRAAHAQVHEVAFVLAQSHHHARVNCRQHRTLVLRNAQLRIENRVRLQRLVDCFEQRVHAFAGLRRDQHLATLA